MCVTGHSILKAVLGKKGKGREIEPVVAPESEVLSLDEAGLQPFSPFMTSSDHGEVEPNPKKRRKDTSNGDLSSVQSTNSVERLYCMYPFPRIILSTLCRQKTNSQKKSSSSRNSIAN